MRIKISKMAGFPQPLPFPAMLSPASASPLLQAIVAHYDELIAYVRHRIGDKAAAQEVVHEVCLKVLKAPDEEPAVQVPLAFLRRMAMHAAIDRYRSERAHAGTICVTDQSLDEFIGFDGGALGLTGPELAAARQQREKSLLRAIRELPPRCQEVFILAHLYHMPQTEVAAKLHISRGMVARHLVRALDTLVPVLHDHD